MTKLHIKDIESLNKLKSEIIELKKTIEKLQEVKRLRKLQQEKDKLENKIIKYSTYDLIKIGKIIAKLMTTFEGKKYYCSKNDGLFHGEGDYRIKPIDYNYFKDENLSAIYYINKIKQERIFFDTKEKKDKCYLPPSNFYSYNSSKTNSKNDVTAYVQVFLDYLYQERSRKLLEEIDEKKLEEILQDFLKNSIELQQQRKEQIEEKIKENIQEKKRKEYEKSCVIDRELILNSLTYIINNYENNMSAKLENKEEWSRSSQWSELTGYQILTINFNNIEISYETEIDSNGCYPDEEYFCINMNKHTDICFFEVKKRLSIALINSNYLLEFMNNIEEMYLVKKSITAEDIQQLLANISNDNKTKQRILNFNKNDKIIL